MKLLEFAAWSMIWLVIMLPVCMAEQLTVQKFSGADNVQNYAKEYDELTIQVLAQMIGNPTPDVARQRVRVYYSDTYSFMDSCTAQAEAMYLCTYKTKDLVFSGTDTYTIRLYDADEREIASITKTLTVDYLAPKVLAFTLSPNMSMAPRLTTVNYRAEDYGYETGKTTGCSGLKTVTFKVNTTEVGSVSTNVSQCSKNGSFTFTPTLNGPNGKVRVCAVATDYLNHKSSPQCREILIDSRKPTAEELVLRDTDGTSIAFARTGQQTVADVYVKISDTDVNGASVFADLSKLNPSLGKKVRDAESGEWFIWRNVAITSPSTCQVTVNATDLMGNKDQKTLTCSIGIDDTPPEPVSIVTTFVDEHGVPLLGLNGTIIAEFNENASGMSKANAFLDLRNLGLAAEAKADKCEKVSSSWKCYWKVRPTVNTGIYTVKLLPITRDNLNNQITKIISANISFDKTAPEGIRVVEIAAFRAEQRVKTNVTSLGETLEFVVEGAGFTKALADLRDLGGDKETPAERCLGNLTKRCTFSITNAVSGPQPTNVTFTFSDAAGNIATTSTSELFILGISNETEPNYWTLSTECSPTMLDRTTLSVYEHPVYCQIKMTSTNTNALPVTVQGPLDLSECSGQTDYISTFGIENNFAGSVEPFIVFTLQPADFEINELNFTCPVSTLTRVGNFIPQNFEHDNVSVSLQFYSLPLGEIYNNINDDVDGVKKSIGGVWKVIGQLEKFMQYGEKICMILTVLFDIVALLTAVGGVLGALGYALSWIPPVGDALKQGSKALCSPADALREVINKDNGILAFAQKFCDFLNCRYSVLDAMGDLGVADTGGVSAQWQSWMSYGMGGFAGTEGDISKLQGSFGADPSTYMNIKDSLIFSIIFPPLCIPGIIYNLDKWRQIQCQYGTCLLQDVRVNGLPASYCKDQKHYLECRFVLGEIFNLIPFAPLANFIMNFAQQILSNPMAIIGAIASIVCKQTCSGGDGALYVICAALSIASQLGKAIEDYKSIKNLGEVGFISTSMCDEFDDKLGEYESSQNE
jgi:hypothetical protein